MHILFLTRGVPSLHDPQNGSFEFDQARALKKLGHTVTIASVDSRFRLTKRKIGLTTQTLDGIKCYNYFLCPGAITGLLGLRTKNKIKHWQWEQLARKIVQNEEKVDIIYSHYLFISYFAIKVSQLLGAPLVAIEHWSELNREPLPLQVLNFGNATYHNTQCVITVSNTLQTRLKQVFNVNARVVYNMVGEEFSYSPTKSSAQMRFVATGSLIYRKGFDMFAKAFANLDLPKDKWLLRIIGEGEEHARLQQQIDAAGFHDNILLLGSKNKPAIAQLLNESDAFILPSRNENFSVAVLEALACGLPVIASICGGIRECIDEKNGVLFEVDDVTGLANCLKHMYEHHQDYDRQAIADDCKARFSSEVIAKQLTEIFEEVVSKHKQQQ